MNYISHPSPHRTPPHPLMFWVKQTALWGAILYKVTKGNESDNVLKWTQEEIENLNCPKSIK